MSPTVVTEITEPAVACDAADVAEPPWVLGQRRQLAVKNVRGAGFRVKVFPQSAFPHIRSNPTVPPGVVVLQFPPRGMPTCVGTSVWLVVSGQ